MDPVPDSFLLVWYGMKVAIGFEGSAHTMQNFSILGYLFLLQLALFCQMMHVVSLMAT